MDIKEVMIGLSVNKINAVDIKDNEKIKEINSKLYNIKRQQIDKAKVYMAEDNVYKKYLTENLEYIKSRLAVNVSVKTTVEASKLLQEVDMRIIIGTDYQYAESFDSGVFLQEEYYEGIELTKNEAECSMAKIINSKDRGVDSIDYLIQENVALGMWIYRVSLYTTKQKAFIDFNKKTKKHLYFLKCNEDANDYSYSIYFDIIELFEIYNKLSNQYSAINQLCQLLNIKIEYEINQQSKYENNLNILQQDYPIKSKYLILYQCLSYHVHLLKVINTEGREHINYSSNSYEGENVFSFSNEFIGNKAVNNENLGMAIKCGKGTVNPKITLFCLLGLLVKIPFEELPKHQRFKTSGYEKEENSYIVPEYTDEVLEEAERRVIMLSEAKMKPTRIAKDKVLEVFGEELYNSVYGNYYNVNA
ncbi:hypothetical protein [Clostridium estertheticum]|uniref:Uncharacterized protein n=1 Tax=Clostridium estertheticum TaxID=238834 RepID=A0A7Y3WTG8_9CLOT|nr:hypothetical protein [Clostridium estertheticum]NNU78162.1 hypothetical protein [Clostridium estertheticum]WBL47725.1 hypothetical protein LOR37_03280 [Clostridium estertheticum]